MFLLNIIAYLIILGFILAFIMFLFELYIEIMYSIGELLRYIGRSIKNGLKQLFF